MPAKKNASSMELRQVTHDFEPDDIDEELSLKEGDILIVLGDSEEDDGWLIGKIRGTSRKGLFPENFTVPYYEEEEPSSNEESDKDAEEEEYDTYDDQESFYEPPGKKSSGKLAIPALNHISMRKEQFRPTGKMNIELPQLRRVESSSASSSSSSFSGTTTVLELPQLRKVDVPSNKNYSSNGTGSAVLELPQLRRVEISLKDPQQQQPSTGSLLEKPQLRKVDFPVSSSGNNSSSSGFVERPTLRHVELPSKVNEPPSRSTSITMQAETPATGASDRAMTRTSSSNKLPLTPAMYLRSTPQTNKPTASSSPPIISYAALPSGYIQQKAPAKPKEAQMAPPVALPGLMKTNAPMSAARPSGPLQPIKESSKNTAAAPVRPPRKSMRIPQGMVNGAKPAGPLMRAMMSSSSVTNASTSSAAAAGSPMNMNNNSGSNNVITMQIPARSLTLAEPPPEQFYTPGTDTYSCSVQLTQSDRMSEKVETFQIKRADRSQVKLTIRQVSGESKASLIAIITQFKSLTQADLDDVADRFGPKIVAFCQSHFGKRVGDGECWTLAMMALKHAGCAAPVGYNFGQEIPLKDARPGDVLQFDRCVFEFPNGGGRQVAGTPNHTAIVSGEIISNTDGVVVPVFEQNPKPCSYGSYDFSCLTSGTVTVFRPLPPS